MKCKKYVLRIILIVFILQIIMLPTVSNAGVWSEAFSTATRFLRNGMTGNTTVNEEEMQDASNTIYYALFSVGVVLTVIIGGILGIKYMIASAEDKAKIKETFIPYILGCVVIYGGFAIWRIVVNLLQGIAVT